MLRISAFWPSIDYSRSNNSFFVIVKYPSRVPIPLVIAGNVSVVGSHRKPEFSVILGDGPAMYNCVIFAGKLSKSGEASVIS